MKGISLLVGVVVVILLASSGPALAQVDVICSEGSCSGTAGDDILSGTPSDELLSGLSGNDLLTGGGGDDAAYGDSGNDRVEGNRGDDLVLGGPADDLVVGGSGGDILRGGSGMDRIEAQDGFGDQISCGVGSGDEAFFDLGLDRVAPSCEVLHGERMFYLPTGGLFCLIFPRSPRCN